MVEEQELLGVQRSIGRIEGMLQKIDQRLAEILEHVRTSDRRIGHVETRLQHLTHELEGVEEWQQQHDERELHREEESQQQRRRLITRRDALWVALLTAAWSALLGALVHLMDMTQLLREVRW